MSARKGAGRRKAGTSAARKHGRAIPLQADVSQSNLSVRPRLKPGAGKLCVDGHITGRGPVEGPDQAASPILPCEAVEPQRCQ